mgnify:CR=1 FL=1
MKRFLKLNAFVFVGILAASVLLTGCAAKRYNKISYCWNSDHRLPPEERFLYVKTAPEDVITQLTHWVMENNGEVIRKDNENGKIPALHPKSSEKFEQALEIADEQWDAYEKNEYREWSKADFLAFQQLIKEQVEWKDAGKIVPHRLIVKVDERSKAITYKKKVGTRTKQVYQPPVIVNLPHKTLVGPAMMTPVTVPVYADANKTLNFYSTLVFLVFENNGKTAVYAFGYPVDATSKVRANYGHSIGYRWWPMVTGEHEAQSIRKAFAYLLEKNSPLLSSQ